MSRDRLHPDDPAASALGRLMRDSGERHGPSSADAELDRLLRVVTGASSEHAPRRGFRGWLLVAAAVVVLGLIGGFGWRAHAGAALTFAANGVKQDGPTAIAADAGRAVHVEFSDGSAFNVEPAAKLRVESSSASGARLTLVDGRTTAQVVHRASSSWSVVAGPFEVRVTGTRFGALWDATNQRLSVELYEGSVQVQGGGLMAPISVRAGQRLEAGTGNGNWLLTSLEGPESTRRGAVTAPLASAMQPSLPDPPVATEPTAPASSIRSSPTTHDWAGMLGRADFQGIVRQADEIGVEHCLAVCATNDLRVLADSARYLGRYELAERSLLALRKRSPSDGASAAFLLARLEEARDSRRALSWYEKSLEEAPAGAYAAEALAGEMRMLLRERGPSGAASAAELYLQRFPGGIHAAKAREILSRARVPSNHR
jgi:ferric-dicitrate binding protein FerR (iron transport regulator)